ncbi:MAG: hypothetical protein K0B02_01965 [DPANN group archaeon]|nr:hypothetical protein [DPANN group archaeon]
MVITVSGKIYQTDFDSRAASQYYLNNGLEETGSANIVNSIVWDFRGYDTLGEESVLFIAATGVYFLSLALRKSIDRRDKKKGEKTKSKLLTKITKI